MVDKIAIEETNERYTAEVGYHICLTKGYVTETSFALSYDELMQLRDLINQELNTFVEE